MEPATLHAAVLAALVAIPHVTTYDGDVPTTVSADQRGRVLPYLVLWANAGHETESAKPLSGAATSSLTQTFMVTCAGGTPERVLQVAALARTALAGLVTSGASPLSEIDLGRPVQFDRATTPPRFYTPLQFRTTAP